LVSVFLASEKFDYDLELDVGMHKTKRATRDMMGDVGVPFSFHHKRILNLAVASRFTGNAKLTHAHPWAIILDPCPPKTHGHGWVWAWAWVWAPAEGSSHQG
jgi:hypothetical protein